MGRGETLLMNDLLAGGPEKEENAVLFPRPPHNPNAVDRPQMFMERQSHLELLVNQEEFGFDSLAFYAQQSYRSSAAILHFLKPDRTSAKMYNARLSLIAGLIHGLDIPLLMVAEPGYESPLDYRDLMFNYTSTGQLIERARGWLEGLPTRPGERRRLGRLKLDIELPIRSFGDYVAESEKKDLPGYFVETNEFADVVNGKAMAFIGRKGTGKTANMLLATSELRSDKRNLVIPVKPSSYDLAGLTEVIGSFTQAGKQEYFLINLWMYLLTSEVAIRAVAHAQDLPAGLGLSSAATKLASTLASMEIDLESDFSTRLDDVLSGFNLDGPEDEASVTLRTAWRDRILPDLKPLLTVHGRVCLLVDNLDKTWERGADYKLLSRFILSLFVSVGKLRDEFGRQKKGQPATELTSTIFLRTDIYDVVAGFAREADKINPRHIQWSDEELIIRVLEDRFAARNRKSRDVDPEQLWENFFCKEVHSIPTRDYLLWRALRRPRDLIFLANAAVSTAINRKHDRVLPTDFVQAEANYSRFAVEALLVESEAKGFGIDDILLGFAGCPSTLEKAAVEESLKAVDDFDAALQWLIQTSFLGLETSNESFVYVEGEVEAKKKLLVATRVAAAKERPVRFRVHPAFRPYLEVLDDDLRQSPGQA